MSYLAGQVVVITKAPFPGQSRYESARSVTAEGGTVESRVGKDTTLLLTDNAEMARIRTGDQGMTTKSAAAVKRGIRIITGDDFNRAINGTPLSQLGYLPPAPAKKAPSKAAAKRQARAEANSLGRRIDGFFPSSLVEASPYAVDF